MRSAAVVVLGDVGRSPRMQYHCLSLARKGVRVALVGYRGEALVPALARAAGFRAVLFSPEVTAVPRAVRKRCYVLFAAVKAVVIAVRLLVALLFRVESRPDVILVQNPPAVPTLLVAWLVARLRGSALVIDWHNLVSAWLERVLLVAGESVETVT